MLVFGGATDGIAPVPAVKAVVPLLTGSPEVRFEIVPGGHLGMLTGRAARGTTWAVMDEWIEQWSTPTPGPPEEGAAPRRSARPRRRPRPRRLRRRRSREPRAKKAPTKKAPAKKTTRPADGPDPPSATIGANPPPLRIRGVARCSR